MSHKLTIKSYRQLGQALMQDVCSALDQDILIYLTQSPETKPIYDIMSMVESCSYDIHNIVELRMTRRIR